MIYALRVYQGIIYQYTIILLIVVVQPAHDLYISSGKESCSESMGAAAPALEAPAVSDGNSGKAVA